jgi:tetratricopeptide (TPR) repeat protein
MAPAAYNLGVLLCRENNDEGFEWLKTAASLAPENWNYLSSYLFFLSQARRAKEIETVLQGAIEQKRAAPEAFFTLAGQYQSEGRIAEAIETYQKAMQNPTLPPDAKRYAAQMEQRLRAESISR